MIEMRLLFIKSIMETDWDRLKMLSIVLCVFYSCVLVAILVDLFFGVRRARKLKIARTSYGFRRTITKATTYFGLMMLLTVADVVASIVLNMPFFTAFGAIGIIIVEAKSVYESTKEYNKGIEEVPRVLVEILKNKDNIQSIIEFLNNNTNESQTIRTEVSSEFSGRGDEDGY
jgi:hypothetical protein